MSIKKSVVSFSIFILSFICCCNAYAQLTVGGPEDSIASSTASCSTGCPVGQNQNPTTCECSCQTSCNTQQVQLSDCSCGCLDSCLAPFVQNASTCDCSCPESCTSPQVRFTNCECGCLSCPLGETLDSTTCACSAPTPTPTRTPTNTPTTTPTRTPDCGSVSVRAAGGDVANGTIYAAQGTYATSWTYDNAGTTGCSSTGLECPKWGLVCGGSGGYTRRTSCTISANTTTATSWDALGPTWDLVPGELCYSDDEEWRARATLTARCCRP